jgi:hypothetical protein
MMNTALTAFCLGSIFSVAVCATVIEGLRNRLKSANMEIEAKRFHVEGLRNRLKSANIEIEAERLHIERLTAQIQLAQSELL